MAFRSVNLNPPRGPRGGGGGGGGGRGGGGGGGGGGFRSVSGSGYNTPLQFDASGRVDQGFGPVGGAATAAEDVFDIFGVDDIATSQQQQNQPSPAPILYVPPVFMLFCTPEQFGRSL